MHLALASPSDVARQVDSAMLILVVFCLVLLVGITAVMIYFVVRYRRSRAPTTKQIHGHLPLEILWTVIPTVLSVGLFFVGYEGFRAMREIPEDALVIRVTGQQWFWSFNYPEADITSSELYVPVDTPVRFALTAPVDDVLHSFYIPAFRIKEDVIPGRETSLFLQADQTGTFNIFCAEFCGQDHASMITKLHVLSAVDYERWLEERVKERYRPVDGQAALMADSQELEGYDGRKLFGQYCVSCHGAEGRGGGPYQARDFTNLAGWKRGTKLTDIFGTISSGVAGSQMRSFGHLPVRERFALMHYVASFAEGQERPAVTSEDVGALQQRYPETDPKKAQRAVVLKPVVPLEQAMEKVVEEGRHR